MAPLKLQSLEMNFNRRDEYPWLRGHGSIEALVVLLAGGLAIVVSMAERSWLH